MYGRSDMAEVAERLASTILEQFRELAYQNGWEQGYREGKEDVLHMCKKEPGELPDVKVNGILYYPDVDVEIPQEQPEHPNQEEA